MNLARLGVWGPWPVIGLALPLMFWPEPLQASPNLQSQRLVRLGQYANASSSIRTQLEANPDDPDLHALAGTVYSRAGLFADAMVPFEFADGSAFYENEGLYAHADALRETGNPEVAAVLRAERLVASDLEEGNELIIGLGLVDDFVRLDEMDRAYDQLMSLQAMWPRSPSLHGHMADFYLDLGDLESAEFHIWYVTDVLGLRMGMRGMFAQYRIHLHNEDLIAAQEVINEAMSLRKQSHRLRARQAEIYRLQGDPSNAVSTLQQRRYWFQEHPEMKAVEALALYESGRLEEAATVAERILKVYPGHPAMAELEPVMVASED